MENPQAENDKRTIAQNKALHLFFKMLAGELNEGGFDQRKVLKETVDIPWTSIAVKDQLWRPIQQAMINERSTTQLEKHLDIEKIHETLMRHLGEKFGIDYIPFPSNEWTEDGLKLKNEL